MDKGISSLPEAAKFRSVLVVIIVLTCVTVFFTYIDKLSNRVEEIARESVITDIKYSLSMLLYDLAIKKNLNDIEKFTNQNPFDQLKKYRSLPVNYQGEITTDNRFKAEGWYFDEMETEVVYLAGNGNKIIYKIHFIEEGGLGRLDIYKEKAEIR